jgi:putative ABC transport system permease protein
MRKVVRDVWSRKTRTLLVSASIFIGVLGVVTLFSSSDLLISQLENDIQQDRLAMMRIFVTVTRAAEIDNAAVLNDLNAQAGVTVVEGRAVYALLWKLPAEERFREGTIATYSSPLDQVQIEPPRKIEGEYPQPGQNQIAIERRMAERWDLRVGDSVDVRVLSGAEGELKQESFVITAILFQPYGEQRGPGFADYESLVFATYSDAQLIGGLNGFNQLYARFVDFPTAEARAQEFREAISYLTPYTPVFFSVEDPAHSVLIENTRSTNQVLIMLALVALIVSGFLVVNVINAIVVEQRRQIGVMKSLGASRWDNFTIYAGIALTYGAIGVIPGVILGIPAGFGMAQALAEQNNTIIDGFAVSPSGILIGIVVGLAVPLLAAIVPVFNGTRVRIIDAMTDLGIRTDYGRGPLSRLITWLPMPLTMRQALHNVNQKKFRLALTGITLTLAVGAFMGIYAVFTSLNAVLDGIFAAFGNQLTIDPNEGQRFEVVRDLIEDPAFQATLAEKGLIGIRAVEPGAQMAIEIDGYEPPPNQAGPPGVAGTGVNTRNPDLFELDMRSGQSWEEDPDLEGVIISSRIADGMGKKPGDTIVIMAGGNHGEFPVLGVVNIPFDWVWMKYEDLARLGGLYLDTEDATGQPEIYPNSISIITDPTDVSAKEVDALIEELNPMLLANGIPANFTNWIEFKDFISQFLLVFNVILYFAAALIALVGAIGLLTTLSMSVFERQKEIGVMRSVGATSQEVALQFLIEGLIIGVAAWAIGIPIGYLISRGLNAALPFEGLAKGFPAETVILGLIGMLVIVTVASLWPSLVAARKTISEILRYQ